MLEPGKEISHWFFGQVPREDIFTRLFLIISSFVGLGALSGVFGNYFLNLPLILSLFCGIIFVYAAAFFYYARKNRKATPNQGIIMVISITVFLVFFWPVNGGYEGPIINYFLTIPIFLAYFLKRSRFYWVLIFIFCVIATMFLYYNQHPELIVHYENEDIRLLDNLISIVITGVALGEISLFFRQENDKILKSLKESNELNKIQNQALKELDEYKNSIFATLGHDLRGPINNAKSIFELLVDDNISKADKENLIKISSAQLEETSALVENILHWARNQMGGITVREVHFDINKIIDQVVDNSQYLIKRKKIFIQSHLAGLFYGFGDPDLFQIVLRNLVNNAIKYSKPGSIITMSVERNFRKELEISVKDEGVGMDKETLEHIFTRGKSTYGTQNEKGTGLGLKLSKQFAEANQGKIWVKSELGKGSIFTFSIREGLRSEVIGIA